MFGCVGLALLNVAAYVRHLDSGDQAGFALGTFFLAAWFLPIAAALLLIGAIWVAPPGAQQESRMGRGIAMAALIAGAVFFLAFDVWMTRTFRPERPSGADSLYGGWSTATILAFSLNLVACSLAVRPGSASPRESGSRWLLGMILAISAIMIYEVAAFVFRGILGKALASEHILVEHIPFMAGPTLVWVAALLWSAWLLRVAIKGRAK